MPILTHRNFERVLSLDRSPLRVVTTQHQRSWQTWKRDCDEEALGTFAKESCLIARKVHEQGDDTPVPPDQPDQEPHAPVREPDDRPESEPSAPVSEPGPTPPRHL